MVDLAARQRVGPFIVTRELSRGVLGDRYLALHQHDQTSHVAHSLSLDQTEPHMALAAVERARALQHPHILPIEQVLVDDAGQVWLITPFTGDQDGIVSLDVLLRRRGGYLSLEEAKRALEQLFSAVCIAHDQGLSHGELSMREVLVDRRGSVTIEHYGLAAQLANQGPALAELKAIEVRSLFAMGYQLATGLRAELPVIPASRVLLDAHPTWDDLFETGLGQPGFTSAAHAASAVDGCITGRSASRRVRSALGGLISR